MKKPYFLKLLTLVVSVLFSLSLKAQLNIGGNPLAFTNQALTPSSPQYISEPFDIQALLKEDESFVRGTGQYRFGKEISVNIDLQSLGIAYPVAGGTVRGFRIKSPGAHSLNFIFSKFRLSEGSVLYIYAPDRNSHIGGFTSATNLKEEVLGTSLVWGDEAVFELFQPEGNAGKDLAVISTLVHGYKDIKAAAGFGTSGSCNMNVNCPDGLPWDAQKRSVAMIVDGGGICTGSMVNNTNNDGTPYFLTANHCFGTRHTSWVFLFNWESQQCTNPPSSPPMNQSVTGSSLLARSTGTDFCLLRLNQQPNPAYNVFMNGWNRAATPPDSGIGIHHPDGDIKKISFYNQPAFPSIEGNPGALCWKMRWTKSTTTEGGSSGSPLYDQNGLVVGQLYGGRASCSRLDSFDWYGRFDQSWELGVTPATRLRDWLDPENYNYPFLPGIDLRCASKPTTLPYLMPFATANSLSNNGFRTVAGASGLQFAYYRISSSIGDTGAFVVNCNASAANQTATMLSQAYNLNDYDSIQVSLDYAGLISSPITDSDTLTISYTTDCGTSFTTLEKLVMNTAFTSSVWPLSTALTAQDFRTLSYKFLGSVTNFTRIQFKIDVSSKANGAVVIDNFKINGLLKPLKPRAAFKVSRTVGCAPLSVTLSDISKYNPTNSKWQTKGAVADTALGQNVVVTYSTPGLYSIKLSTSNANGFDSTELNNIIEVLPNDTSALPMNEKFKPGTLNWTALNNKKDTNWAYAVDISATNDTSGSFRFSNWRTTFTGLESYLISKNISLKNKPNTTFKFNYAYITAGFGTPTDSLKVAYSTDCGQTWRIVWRNGGTSLSTATRANRFFIPTATQWRNISVNLPAQIANFDNVRFAFVNRSAGGSVSNNIYIDDIQIEFCTPPAKPTITTLNSACEGSRINLTATVPTGTLSYLWQGPGLNSGAVSPNFVVTAASSGWYTLSLSSNGCSGFADSLFLSVLPRPTKPTILASSDTLYALPLINSGQYTWYKDGSLTATTGTPFLKITQPGFYWVIYSDLNACNNTSDPIQILVVSNKGNLIENKLNFNNPVQDILSLNNIEAIESLVFTDVAGRILLKQSNLPINAEISLAKLSRGTYLMTAVNKGSRATYKVVKE